MPVILKQNRLFVFIFLSCFYFAAHGQELTTCKVLKVEGLFAYESTCDLWSEDDMIYRRASVFALENDTINFNGGLFAFEHGIGVPRKCITPENEDKIKYFSVSLNDSIHSIIDNLHSTSINTSGGTYKRLLLSMDVMFIRYDKVRIREGTNFIERFIPVYLILHFYYIMPS